MSKHGRNVNLTQTQFLPEALQIVGDVVLIHVIMIQRGHSVPETPFLAVRGKLGLCNEVVFQEWRVIYLAM